MAEKFSERLSSSRRGDARSALDSWDLTEALVSLTPSRRRRYDIEVRGGRVVSLRPPGECPPGVRSIDLQGCLVLPGLINAHDHLEFNLFPRLGRGPHPNAGAWAREIYHPVRPPLREHLGVPMSARLRWGGIKNLLSGVTTVCHHNPYNPRVFDDNFPVRVQKNLGWAHSLEFSPDVARGFQKTPADRPFILHLGEATDALGKDEIFCLEAMHALDQRTVLVHGVALDSRGLRLLQKRGGSLVWCPSSNLFILGRTLNRRVIGDGIPVALGTDSALSGEGDLLDELQVAQRVGQFPVSRLYRMVTEDAARILRLEQGEGTITEGGIADLVVVRDQGLSPAATLMGLRTGAIELILVGGKVKLVSPRLAEKLPVSVRRCLHMLAVEDRGEKRMLLLDADLPKLFRQAARFLGCEIRLAGKRVMTEDREGPEIRNSKPEIRNKSE